MRFARGVVALTRASIRVDQYYASVSGCVLAIALLALGAALVRRTAGEGRVAGFSTAYAIMTSILSLAVLLLSPDAIYNDGAPGASWPRGVAVAVSRRF